MPEHSLEKVVPDGNIYLIFELDSMPRFIFHNLSLKRKSEKTRAWVSGIQTSYITINALPDSEMFIVKFKPYGALPFLNCGLVELTDRVVDAEKVMGDAVFELRELLLQPASYEDKMTLCEQWLLARLNEESTPQDFVVHACDKMRNDPAFEFNSIADLIAEANVSKKHFVNSFKKYVGLTPKQLQRIFRFNDIFVAIQKEKTIQWTQIALSCGYYDQAHFIKEFKAFCGTNPSKFMVDHKNTDRVNFFPVD